MKNDVIKLKKKRGKIFCIRYRSVCWLFIYFSQFSLYLDHFCYDCKTTFLSVLNFIHRGNCFFHISRRMACDACVTARIYRIERFVSIGHRFPLTYWLVIGLSLSLPLPFSLFSTFSPSPRLFLSLSGLPHDTACILQFPENSPRPLRRQRTKKWIK